MLTQEELKQYLHYNPETGIFTWVKSVKGSRGKGKEAGTLTRKGYVDVSIAGKKYGLHRLAFLYMTGEIPHNVDHINNVKNDNRWCNLRAATVTQNSYNYKGTGSSTGYRNVYYDPRGVKKFFVVIVANKVVHKLGYFMTPEEANEVAKSKRKELHGEFAYEATMD